ncbi:MAG: N-acetyltransferase [Candidatus Brocadiia bacterium]
MIEKARIDEAQDVMHLVNHFAERELMLPRSLNDMYENLRDFLVWREDGRVVGCVALHVSWQGLGEIRSLAVAEGEQHRGIGTALVEACLAEARELGMDDVFVLTYLPGFFERFGFRPYPKDSLPHKIWTDCLNCPKFPDCDEVALMLELDG